MCTICSTVLAPTRSHYEHKWQLYCQQHFLTSFVMTKCTGCCSEILEDYVKTNKDSCWHFGCYMIQKVSIAVKTSLFIWLVWVPSLGMSKLLQHQLGSRLSLLDKTEVRRNKCPWMACTQETFRVATPLLSWMHRFSSFLFLSYLRAHDPERILPYVDRGTFVFWLVRRL